MEIRVDRLTVHTKRTFAIARSSADSFERVVLTLEEDGATGRGEAAPSGYYGQNAADVTEALETVTVPKPWDIEETLWAHDYLPPSALCALDVALHDLAARRLRIPVHRLLGLARPYPVTSAYTLGIADPETTIEEAKMLSEYPILKMKVGGWKDLETVRAVSEFRGAPWVDANEAFSPEEAPAVVRELVGMGATLIEQPVPAAEGPEAMKRATEAAHPIPVVADESAINAADIPKLAGCVSGVNVKLAKCGGIRGALRMIHTARAHGMLVMLGCMVETSLGIAAAAQLGGLVDAVDLDGAMLLADDPFGGPTYDKGRIFLPEGPGLGTGLR